MGQHNITKGFFSYMETSTSSSAKRNEEQHLLGKVFPAKEINTSTEHGANNAKVMDSVPV